MQFFYNIDSDEVNYVSGIILNILQRRIKTDFKLHTILKRMKNYLLKLKSKSVSYKVEKQLLTSLKGLNLINIIMPYLLILFNMNLCYLIPRSDINEIF